MTSDNQRQRADDVRDWQVTARGKFPMRVETGLCPGLEEALAEVADQLDRLAETIRATAQNGCVGSEGAAGLIESIGERARERLSTWAPRSARIDGDVCGGDAPPREL